MQPIPDDMVITSKIYVVVVKCEWALTEWVHDEKLDCVKYLQLIIVQTEKY